MTNKIFIIFFHTSMSLAMKDASNGIFKQGREGHFFGQYLKEP